MDTNVVLSGEYGARIATAVAKVAERVEKGIPRVIAGAATPDSAGKSSALPGACILKQVRKAAGRMHSADLAPGALTASTKQ